MGLCALSRSSSAPLAMTVELMSLLFKDFWSSCPYYSRTSRAHVLSIQGILELMSVLFKDSQVY